MPGSQGVATATGGSVPAEFRFAVTMNGGVSLAVWIGGVAHELYELAASRPERSSPTASRRAYDDLLAVAQAGVSIDVMSGASAGGINAALLGVAFANEAPSLAPAREIWLDQGDISGLLRPVGVKRPRSLLDGERFRAALAAGFDAIRSTGHGLDPAPELLVLLTGTQLDGTTRRLPDSIGSEVIDTDFEAVFTFDGKSLADPEINPHLALAARASASFQAMFEPVWVPTTPTESKDAPNMAPYLDGGKSHGPGLWMVDGGSLNNKPIGLAIDEVFKRKAAGRVIRKLAYVVPDPGADDRSGTGAGSASGSDGKAPPALARVLYQSLVTAPRNQSIASSIADIAAHNDKVGQYRRTRLNLARSVDGGDLVAIASKFEAAYREHHSRESARRSTGLVTTRLQQRRQWEAVQRVYTAGEIEDALAEVRLRHIPQPFLPSTDPSIHGEPDGQGGSYWGYGITTAKRIAGTVIDIVQAVLAELPAQPGPAIAPQVTALIDAQRLAHEQLATIVKRWEGGGSTWFDDTVDQLVQQAGRAGPTGATPELLSWAHEYYGRWQGDQKSLRFRAVGAAAKVCASLLRSISGSIGDLARWTDLPVEGRRQLADLAQAVATLTDRGQPATAGTSYDEAAADEVPVTDAALTDDEWTLRQLLALELIYVGSGGSSDLVDQRLDLFQVSAFADCHLDNTRTTPHDKVTGVALGHFAGFYKRSWRANDWMWGRLDGASRIIDAVLDPARLRQVWFGDPDGLVAAIEQAATSSAKPGVSAYLQQGWATASATEAFRNEIAAISTRPTLDNPKLTTLRRLIGTRLQLEIVLDELAGLAYAVHRDRAEGSFATTAADEFLRRTADAFDAPSLHPGATFDPTRSEQQLKTGTVDVGGVVDAFRACSVGRERVHDDLGSDRLTSIIGRTAVISTTAARNSTTWPPANAVLGAFRSAGLLLYLLTGLVTPRARRGATAQLALILAFAAGAAGIGIIVTADNLGLTSSLICLVLIGIPLIVAGLRLRLLPVALALVLITALALAAWHLDPLLTRLGNEPPRGGERTGAWGWLVDQRELVALAIIITGLLLVGAVASAKEPGPRRVTVGDGSR